jgi:hypothetical protein
MFGVSQHDHWKWRRLESITWQDRNLSQLKKGFTFATFTNGTNAIETANAHLDFKMTSLNTCGHWKATTCIEIYIYIQT